MSGSPAPGTGLRRSLNIWQAVGLSVALMAPSMAANINPQGTAGLVGRAVPLSFLLAAIGVMLIAYVFVRLCQHFSSSGSVYAFVGATLGARTGVVSGWALMGGYLFFGVTTSTVVGLFATSFLQEAGWWTNQPSWAPWIFAAVALILCYVLTAAPVKRGTNVLLSVEGATVVLILLVSVVVLVKVLTNHAPAGQTFTLSVFSLPKGTGASTVFLGIVYGFLSFAGFEAASTLGEESEHPRRDIPRAILGTAVFGGIYFVVVTAIEVMGFGTDSKGVSNFVASSSLIGTLGQEYVASWVGTLVTFGAMVSAFGCALASTVGATRLLYTLGRDGFGEKGIGRTSKLGTPANAGGAVVGLIALVIAVCIAGVHASADDVFLWGGAIGTLIILVAYVLTTIGAIKLFFVDRAGNIPMWQVVVPVLAIVLLGYTLYRNVFPYPASDQPGFWYPIVAGGWLLFSILVVLLLPEAAKRMGVELTKMIAVTDAESEGLELAEVEVAADVADVADVAEGAGMTEVAGE